MKNPRSNSDQRWERLLRDARGDVGPAANVPALLHVVREAASRTPQGWTAEFFAFFGSWRVVSGCLAGTSAVALVATWQIWDTWQAVPWAQLLASSIGGAA